jgi:hypothetical protein
MIQPLNSPIVGYFMTRMIPLNVLQARVSHCDLNDAPSEEKHTVLCYDPTDIPSKWSYNGLYYD